MEANPRGGLFETVVLGTSSGGMEAIQIILAALPGDFSLAVIIVQHISPDSDGAWAELLDGSCELEVKEADEKEKIMPGVTYVAPANYHLLVEPDRTFSLSVDEHVNYARPSIDVTLETAAEAYGPRLVGAVLTGGNADGARGLRYAKNKGGLTIAEDPDTATTSAMPEAAISIADPDYILSLDDIKRLLIRIHQNQTRELSQ